MARRDLIVIGASAGGLGPLQEIVAGLPADLPATVLIVLHMPPTGGDAFRKILARVSALPVRIAQQGDDLEPGVVLVARGGLHLLVGPGHVHVRSGPRENGHRPAIDALFRSAAAYYGPRVIGVVLSWSLNDGTAGLVAIKEEGGLAVVQNPEEALYESMPATALRYVDADYIARGGEIGPLLGELAAKGGREDPEPPSESLLNEVELMEKEFPDTDAHPGRPSPWPCPDCHGVLWEIEEGPILRFRCRVGHAWAAESLLHEQSQGVEGALWMALRALEDRADLSRRLAQTASEANRRISAARYGEELDSMQRSIAILQQLLSGGIGTRPTSAAEDEGTAHDR